MWKGRHAAGKCQQCTYGRSETSSGIRRTQATHAGRRRSQRVWFPLGRERGRTHDSRAGDLLALIETAPGRALRMLVSADR